MGTFEARRRGEPIGGQPCFMEIRFSQGDAFVRVVGKHPITDQPQDAQIEFCAPFGGGYHPRTIQALAKLDEAFEKLIQAMAEDNADPENPKRYKDEAEA